MPLPQSLNTLKNISHLKGLNSTDLQILENIMTELDYLAPTFVAEISFAKLLKYLRDVISMVENRCRYPRSVIRDFPFLVCWTFLIIKHGLFNEKRFNKCLYADRVFFQSFSLLYRTSPSLFTKDVFDILTVNPPTMYEKTRALIFLHEAGFLDSNLSFILESFEPIAEDEPVKGPLLTHILIKLFEHNRMLITHNG